MRLLSKNDAVLSLERDLATSKSRRAADAGQPPSAITEDLRKLRGFAERRLNAAIRTLAYARHLEASSVETTLNRLRILKAS
jgi:hypothetical protein